MASKYSYFKHDRSARSDLKMQKIISKYGSDGYGLFWIITEIMYSDGGYVQRDEDTMCIIKHQANTSIDIDKFIDYCICIELFHLNNIGIYNKRISNELSDEKKLKEIFSEAGRKSVEVKKKMNLKDYSSIVLSLQSSGVEFKDMSDEQIIACKEYGLKDSVLFDEIKKRCL